MKKLFLSLAVIMICNLASAQQKVYCELLGHSKIFGPKLTVTIDFGQNQWQNNKLVDESGKALSFNSMIDAMNFMGKLGWEFEHAYVVTIGSGSSAQNVYHWLLSKYIIEEERIDEGLTTKAQHKAALKQSEQKESEE